MTNVYTSRERRRRNDNNVSLRQQYHVGVTRNVAFDQNYTENFTFLLKQHITATM